MKTAAVVYEFPSHTETFVAGQIRGLVELGCDVRIFADGPDPVGHTRATDYDLQDRVVYYGLPLKTLRDAAGKLRSAFPSPARQVGLKPRPRLPSLRQRFEARRFGGETFDVIHSHFGPVGVRAIKLRELGALHGPVITSFYGYDAGRRWSQNDYDMLFEKGDLFIALSQSMRSSLLSLGCDPDRIRIHRLGIDIDRFIPGPRTKRTALHVLSVARLVPKKGIEFGLDAVAELLRRRVEVRYTIVGGGLLRRSLERRAAKLGIYGQVRFLGPQTPARVVELMHEADVLVAPSVTSDDGDIEGTPVAILEAQACGLPVVATRHAGIPEIVNEGESGYLAVERNSVQLADLLERFVESPSLRVTMGNEGRAAVTRDHDIRKLNKQLLGIYEEVKR